MEAERKTQKLTTHKDLRVWQEAMDLAMEVFRATKAFPADERYSLTDQVRRSSRSVPANIAEAWRKRRYEAAFVSKLNDAEGEAAETQTHLEIAFRCGYLGADLKAALDERYERLLAQIVTMATRPEVWTSSSPQVPKSHRPKGKAMSFSQLIAALALPPDARVDLRVPKKQLLEQGAPTSADKKHIQNGIEEMIWVAALKPTNIGVPAFRDDVREYLEIAVLTVVFRVAAKPARLIELIHRAIPYPVVLVTVHAGEVSLSLAHKRWSQGEAGKVVIDDLRQTPPFRFHAPAPEETAFLASIALSGLPSRDLFALYQGWLDRVATLEAARITGAFVPPGSADRASALREGLDIHTRLQRELTVLRAQAAKEKQMNRRVQLNLEIKRLEAEQARARQGLHPEAERSP